MVPHLANFDQSNRVTDQNTSNIWGKNPLPIKFLPLLERKPAKISCERKKIMWATKLAKNRKARGKRREREKKIEIDSQKKETNKQVQILAYAHAQKTQKVLCFIQLAENYVLSVGNIFFSHSHANWPKNGSKRRIWSKMRFFFAKSWMTAKG